MNESVTEVFVEQPLASPGSAKYIKYEVSEVWSSMTFLNGTKVSIYHRFQIQADGGAQWAMISQ